MKALQNLTQLIKQHVADAKHFDAWAEDGALFCGQGVEVDGFELEYTVIIFVQDTAIEPARLFMHLVNWLNKHDPYRMEKGLPNPTFATELLDKGRCDIKLKIDIREPYELTEDPNGPWQRGDTRFECVSEFSAIADQDDLGELVLFVGHEEDLP